ncbi:nectin-4 [Cyprinodon tularosa]|uniref:nectin-4 n=1 Tax=Cyprinodon tularosa TaxID=77115 RepID=UPI0018E280EA|nr:nectin-4 [Cyprinodon tularosa]
MKSIRSLSELLLLFLILPCVWGAFVEPLQPNTDILSFTDSPTRLPCHYKAAPGENVVQVTWNKELPDGRDDPVIMAHFTEGIKEFSQYSSLVRFESFYPTKESSALLIPQTQVSDEGVYKCHISTFPNGNFERHIKLSVWTLPISSLDPVHLVEGQPYGVVASCRAVGRPPPQLSWDTDLPGHSNNRTNDGGSVSSHYSLHPLRSMNGKKLDCLVWHPGLQKPRRISNNLVVQYPPDPIISTRTDYWYIGLTQAELVCEGRGNPEPQKVTWTWRGGALPDGVSIAGEKLIFGRAIRLNDSGVYECSVRNDVGSGKTMYTLTISERPRGKLDLNEPGDNLLLIIIGTTAGVLVLVLVTAVLVVRWHHGRKTKMLKMELRETRDEIDTLSRQASFRRLNSASSVSRMQPEDYALLRVDSRTKYSQMSLDRTAHRCSQSTLAERWGPAADVTWDECGRPVVWNVETESMRVSETNREKERRKKVESNVKSSNMSLDSGLPSSLVPLKNQQDEANGCKEPDLGHLQEGGSLPEDDSMPESSTTDGQEDSDGNSSQHLSKTLSKMFYARNGVLRPIERPTAILLQSNQYYRPQII